MSVSHIWTLFDIFETTYHVIKIYSIWYTNTGSQFAGDEYKFTHGYQRCFVYIQITSYHK